MAKVTLAVLQPRVAATGAIVTARLSGGGERAHTYQGTTEWLVGLQPLPPSTSLLGFDELGPTGGSTPGGRQLTWQGEKADTDTLAAYAWFGAAATVYEIEDDGTGQRTLLSGFVADLKVAPTSDSRALIFDLVDAALDFDKPVIDATFAGTGGVEGGASIAGRAKRRAWGVVRNVELWALDEANNIWVATDPTRSLQAITAVKDAGLPATGVVAVAWAGSVAATLAALVAVNLGNGTVNQAAAAPSIAAVKWYRADPVKLTVDLQGETSGGYTNRPLGIAASILTARAPRGLVGASQTAVAAARDIACGLLVEEQSETIAAALDRLLGGVSVWWSLTAAGLVDVGTWTWGASLATLDGFNVERVQTYRPHHTRKLGYARNHYQHSKGEIAGIILAGDVSGLGALAVKNTADFAADVGGVTKPEANATRTLPFDRLHRNTSFELFDGVNFPGWTKFGLGTIARISATFAQDGQYIAVLNGFAGIESEQFPLSAGQTVYPVIRIGCNGGTVTPLGSASYFATLRLYPGDGTARFADLNILNGVLVGQAGFTTFNQGGYTIPANVADLSGTGTNFAPRYASAVVVQDFGNGASLASGLVDFFEIGAFEFGSTRSRVTRAGVAPANPTVNDLWVDTSVTPNVTRTWSGALWVASANLATQGSHVGVDNGATNNAGLDLTLGGTIGDVVLTKGGANGSTTLTPLARIDRNLRSSLGLTLDDNYVLNAYGQQANQISDPKFERKASSIDWPLRGGDSFMVLELAIDGNRLRIDPNSGSCFLGVERQCSPGERIDATVELFRASANGTCGIFVNFFDRNGGFVAGGGYAIGATAVEHPLNAWLRRDGFVIAPLVGDVAIARIFVIVDAAHTTGQWYVRKPVAIVSPRANQHLGANGRQIGRKLQRALLNAGGAHVSGLSFSSNDSQISISNFSIDTSDGYQAITGELVGGLSAGTTYYIWGNLPEQDNTGRSFSLSTSFNGHTNAERVRLGAWATTSGGAGGGGSSNCVALDSFIDEGVRARHVGAGTRIRLLKRDYSGWEWGEVESVEWATSPMVRIVTESAKTLEVAETTPFEFRDGSFTEARFLTGREVAVLIGDRMRWERVVRVQPIGAAGVARIHVGGRVYFAGASMRALIANHNPDKP